MSLHERTLEGIEKKANADLLFTSPMDGINWACSAQTDMLILVDEVRRLRGIEERVRAALAEKQEQAGKSLEAALKASISDEIGTGSVWGHTKVAARFKRQAKGLEGFLNG